MNQLSRAMILSVGCLLFGTIVNACTTEYNDPCTFPDAEQLNRICLGNESNQGGVCVYRTAADCDTQLCATFMGSDPYCTQACESDGDCPSGSSCHEVVDGDTNVCVPNDLQ